MAYVDIEFMKEVALEAGEKAAGMTGRLKAEFKEDSSYVTNIDRTIEQYVAGRLAERYPDYSFLGEEFGMRGDESAPMWAVDPIDGTTNMVFGIPFWCVSIGLMVNAVPVAGAVYMPCTDELFWGEAGRGSFRNGVRLAPPDHAEFNQEDTLGFTSGAIKNLATARITGRLRCIGSIAGDILYTASGALCCLVGYREGAYDMAAALCVAYEAGCEATYLTGEPLDLAEVMRNGRTQAPFVVATPKAADLIRRTELRERL